MTSNTQTEQTEQTAESTPLRTPGQWSEELHPIAWQHACAGQLHGWREHAHHFPDKPILLSQFDYEQALASASAFPAAKPHWPALSELKHEEFANFKPREARQKEQG